MAKGMNASSPVKVAARAISVRFVNSSAPITDNRDESLTSIINSPATAGKTHLFWGDVLTGSSNSLSTTSAAIEYSEGGFNGRDATIAHDINGNGLSDVLINAYGSRQVGIFSACDPQ